MTMLPGLTSHQDDVIQSRGNAGPSRGGRVVTNAQGARAGSLAPQAAPVDTYFRPERAPQDDSIAQLAESLASLNPALMRYANVRKETMDETLSARVTQRYAGKSYEEQKVLMKDDPDAQSLLGRRAIAANVGRAAAAQAGRTAAEFYETQFDKDGGDLDGYLNGVLRSAIDEHPDDPLFAEQFAEVFQPMAASIRSEHTKYRVGTTQEKVAETVHGSWLGTVQSGILKGEDPTAIAETIRGSYETNKQGLKMSFPDQDKAVVGVIQQLTLQMEQEPGNADKIFGVIKALSTGDRTSSDGTKMGRLLDSGSLGPDVAKLLTAADAKVSEIRQRENYKVTDDLMVQAESGNLDADALDTLFNDPTKKGLITEQRRETLLRIDRTAKEQINDKLIKAQEKDRVRQDLGAITGDAVSAADEGRLSLIEDRDYVDENGEVKSVNVEKQRKEVVGAVLDREKRRVASDKRDPSVVAAESFERQVEVFSKNGLEQPQWSQTMEAGVAAMTTGMATGEISDTTMQGFDLYKQLAAKTPNYLRSLVGADEANVYEAARILEQAGVAGTKEALAATQRYFADPTRTSSGTAGLRSGQIVEEVDRLGGQLSNFDNGHVMNPEIEKLAAVLVGAGGLSPKAAVTKAVESVSQGYQTVNGWAVKTSDRRVPPNFGELATHYLTQWQARNGADLSYDLDDLAVSAVAGGAWQIIEKSTGLPVRAGGTETFTTGQLGRLNEVRREAAVDKVVKDNAKRNEPLFNWGGIKIGKPRWFWSKKDFEDFESK